jgi:hypothetical protein
MASLSEITRTHPIVLIMKGPQLETHQIIANLASIQPPLKESPMCLDLEGRPDADLLLQELRSLTGKDPPALYVKGVYLGQHHQVIELVQSGKLAALLHSEDLLTNEEDTLQRENSADESSDRTRQGRRQSRFRL